jgi:hypothetical protein
LSFTAIGGKRQGREVPQSLRVKPGASHPVWETQSKKQITIVGLPVGLLSRLCPLNQEKCLF